MGKYTKIIELYGVPACGKTTLSQAIEKWSKRKGLTVQNYNNAIDDLKRISFAKCLSCISVKSLYYALYFLYFFIPRNQLRRRMTYVGWLKMSFLANFYRKYTDYDLVISDEGVIQRIISWKSGIDEHSEAIDKVIVKYLKSLRSIQYIYCQVDINLAMERLLSRQGSNGRLTKIKSNEELHAQYVFEDDQFIHYTDILVLLDKKVMMLDTTQPIEKLVEQMEKLFL